MLFKDEEFESEKRTIVSKNMQGVDQNFLLGDWYLPWEQWTSETVESSWYIPWAITICVNAGSKHPVIFTVKLGKQLFFLIFY